MHHDWVTFTGNNAFEVFAFIGRDDLVPNLDLHATDRPVVNGVEMRTGDRVRKAELGYEVVRA